MGLTTASANVYRGKQALEFTLPKQEAELSDAVDKVLKPERDILFLRYYSKYDSPYDVVGSSHNGAGISAHYYINGQATPGVPANGTNKFLANLETWRGEAGTPRRGISTFTSTIPASAASGATTSSPRAWSCPTPAWPSISAPPS